ncbi:hypothetical protein Cgig2_016939 [Carnegiea gigantea]|uniref:Uncharacterized protein n=1 Tax=Carnegiea gigantea TaxID=171969 RepID=A0A9Q1JQ87_9CARY|nr:hypothetical protein Cgig2_016939 [Carnegiea gigantea]
MSDQLRRASMAMTEHAKRVLALPYTKSGGGDNSCNSSQSSGPFFAKAVKFGVGCANPHPQGDGTPLLLPPANSNPPLGSSWASTHGLNSENIVLANPAAMRSEEASINEDPLDAMDDDLYQGDLRRGLADTFLNLEPIQDIEMSSESFKMHRTEEEDEGVATLKSLILDPKSCYPVLGESISHALKPLPMGSSQVPMDSSSPVWKSILRIRVVLIKGSRDFSIKSTTWAANDNVPPDGPELSFKWI